MGDVFPKQDGSDLILRDNAHSQGFDRSGEPLLGMVAMCVAYQVV